MPSTADSATHQEVREKFKSHVTTRLCGGVIQKKTVNPGYLL